MFDSETAELIRAAPRLNDVDPQTLPQELTDAYAELVALRLRTAAPGAGPESEQRLIRLRRIAATYEAAVDTGAEGKARRAAAFVAATAQQIIARIDASKVEQAPPLTAGFVHPSLASPLLFLISEQSPDAREAARLIPGFLRGDLITDALVESIYDLATENFVGIIERAQRLEHARPFDNVPDSFRATQALYGQCWAGLVHIVSLLVNRPLPATVFLRLDTPQDAFDRVVQLATGDLRVTFDGEVRHTPSDYPGPRHLARLLRHVASTLADAGLARLKPPNGAAPAFWDRWAGHRARTKPLLWRNHRAAVATGFLDAGHSAVLVLPTGAGKTTLSELKIASTLAAGRKVVFLVPTLALVDQLKDDLAESFPSSLDNIAVAADGDLAALTPGTPLSEIEVMTPERCLAMLSYADADVSEVGLVVFDECHLLSPKGGGSRSLDAMLCLLHVLDRMPDADLLLLSAMLTNHEEVADWLATVAGRDCTSFHDPWKPSRQARGVVVYAREELNEITRNARAEHAAKDKLRKEKGKAKKLGQTFKGTKPPKANLAATPYALFGLQQNWHPKAPTDTRLVRLTNEAVELAFSTHHVTPNANVVGAMLATRAGKVGLKVILFVQQADHAPSTAKKIAADASDPHPLTPSEATLWSSIVAETGGEEHSLVDPSASALPHNGDMLPLERRLAESLFRRQDGVNVIVATPTLAQGMNLPVQLALLAGDKRHGDNGREDLERHELLNAAGRAGRAGVLANGTVLLIPEPVVAFDPSQSAEPPALEKLRAILPANDQCVQVDDPLTELLDQIQSRDTDFRVRYLVSRLQARDESIHDAERSIEIVRRSLAAYRAKKERTDSAFEARVAALRTVLAEQGVSGSAAVRRVSAFTGIALEPLGLAEHQLTQDVGALPETIVGWSDWLIDFLAADPKHLDLLHPSEVETLTYVVRGRKTGGALTAGEMSILKLGMQAWLEGRPLSAIEKVLGVADSGVGSCPRARDLMLKIANRPFYLLIGAIADLVRAACESEQRNPPGPAALETLAVAFRKGLDLPAKVAFAHWRPQIRSRVLLHAEYNKDYALFEAIPGSDYATIRGAIGLRELGFDP